MSASAPAFRLVVRADGAERVGRGGLAARCTGAGRRSGGRRPIRRSTTRTTAGSPASSAGARSGNSCRSRGEDTPLRLFTSLDSATLGGKFTSRCTWFASPLNSASSRLEVRAHVPHDLLHAGPGARGEHRVPVLGHEDQMGVQDEDTVPASAYVPVTGHEAKYTDRVQLRYNYRLYPSPASVRRWPGRSAAPGSCSTTRCAPGGKHTRPGSRTSPTRNCRPRLTAAKATPGAGLAGRGLCGGAPAVPRGPDRGVPELLRLRHRQAEGAEGRAAPVPVPQGPQAGGPVHRQRPVHASRAAGSCGCRRSGTCRSAGPATCPLSRHRSP